MNDNEVKVVFKVYERLHNIRNNVYAMLDRIEEITKAISVTRSDCTDKIDNIRILSNIKMLSDDISSTYNDVESVSNIAFGLIEENQDAVERLGLFGDDS